MFVFFWLINGISHEIPLQIGDIYHHFCKDNSITNIVMAVLLFYLVKGIPLNVKPVNKAASFLFAAFALNNQFVSIAMHLIGSKPFELPANSFLGGAGTGSRRSADSAVLPSNRHGSGINLRSARSKNRPNYHRGSEKICFHLSKMEFLGN